MGLSVTEKSRVMKAVALIEEMEQRLSRLEAEMEKGQVPASKPASKPAKTDE